MAGHRALQRLTRLVHGLEPPRPRRPPGYPASGATAPVSVLCCIDDAGPSSLAALQFAVRTASRRRHGGPVDLAVVLVCPVPFFFMADAFPHGEWLGPGADVGVAVSEVLAGHGLAPRVHQVAGWSRADIVSIARAQGSDVVILPMLGDGAGPVLRWTRRELVTALVAQAKAVVLDEYDQSSAA